jgi:hypothetical protein
MRPGLLIFLLTIAIAAHAHRIDTADGALTIFNNIHPLYTPHGQILTRIQPPDHYHHYGIWDPWTHILFKGDTIDRWNIAARKGTQRFAKFASITSGPPFAEFQALQQHVAFHKDGSEEVFLNDRLTVSIFAWDSNSYLLAHPRSGAY